MTTARYMLDTKMCVYLRRRRPAEVVQRFAKLAPGEAVISVITYGELQYGAERNAARERLLDSLGEFIALIPVYTLPMDAGAAYGAIRAALERRGETIGSNDLWIAAHARAANLTLVTNNEREFRRVPGLKIENWALS
ncbi:MAG: type II toxin-antitoxin system VapC family toxin [Pseudomonadota bacterium]|nr:type II toxin-antitoxin system VapC family toxin [Pseudomonadota bacterium]